MTEPITFDRHPDQYRHWRLTIDEPVATLAMAVDPAGGISDAYQLKLNTYDVGVDIELADAIQRLRFEHPEVRAVVLTSGLDKVFSAGANIQMLAGATHDHKVNFCKFTNETRLAIEDATANSGQAWLCAVNGTAAGGGYELALACDEIVLVDDRSSAVSLPEVPLLAVLPGTGGLTRVVDKRKVRRDLADVFATKSEGIRGQQAVDWGLVDAVSARSQFDETVRQRALARADQSDRPAGAAGIELTPLAVTVTGDTATGRTLSYPHLDIHLDRDLGAATFVITSPRGDLPSSAQEIVDAAADFWPLAVCRALDHAISHLRFNEPEIGTWLFRTAGDASRVASADDLLGEHRDHWLVREIILYWKRTLKRLDLSARTLITLVEPGSCFTGTLAELVLAADRSFMLEGTFEDSDHRPATLQLSDVNTGWYPMSNGLTRLHSRFYGHDERLADVEANLGKELSAELAGGLGLVTFTPDDIDWDDEIRMTLEERTSFSPDALTGLEANLRFVGPETMETKLFGRLSTWQNWIFQRPNAAGADGALRRYGTGSRPTYDRKRA
jgi:benzoyl-CoA-dihydrodiol lyase